MGEVGAQMKGVLIHFQWKWEYAAGKACGRSFIFIPFTLPYLTMDTSLYGNFTLTVKNFQSLMTAYSLDFKCNT